jgi:Protein of unknown function (DUF2946)
MRLDRAIHRQLAWLALCALLMGAVAPSISLLLARSQSGAWADAWADICRASGAQPGARDLGVQTPPSAPMAADIHCGYCLLQHYSPVVPTPTYSLNVAIASADRLPVGGGGTTLFKRFLWRAHHARAPPAFS